MFPHLFVPLCGSGVQIAQAALTILRKAWLPLQITMLHDPIQNHLSFMCVLVLDCLLPVPLGRPFWILLHPALRNFVHSGNIPLPRLQSFSFVSISSSSLCSYILSLAFTLLEDGWSVVFFPHSLFLLHWTSKNSSHLINSFCLYHPYSSNGPSGFTPL